jgi:hypothetical protein
LLIGLFTGTTWKALFGILRNRLKKTAVPEGTAV